MLHRLSRRLAGHLVLAMLAAVLSGCASPHLLGTPAGTGDKTLARQIARLKDDPTPPDAPRYIFLGAALHGNSRSFDGDIRLLDQQFARQYGAAYRSVLLSNRRLLEGDRDLPLASVEQVDETFKALATLKRPNDRFIVLLTSHGGPGKLEVEQSPLYANPLLLPSKRLGTWVAPLAPNRTWVIVSACYSGSHLPALSQPHLLTMTAARADRNSFGCSDQHEHSWFVRELADALAQPQPQDFNTLWADTRARVARREEVSRLQGSEPQWRVGGDWRALLAQDWTRY